MVFEHYCSVIKIQIEMKHGYYRVCDCEHEGDIETAKREVTEAGGIVDDAISENKDTDEEIDDYYESKEWYIVFHCENEKTFKEVCKKLGL